MGKKHQISKQLKYWYNYKFRLYLYLYSHINPITKIITTGLLYFPLGTSLKVLKEISL